MTVHFPDLKENQLIIPGTTKLTFNISLAGTDVNRTLVKNLGRNIIRKLVVKLEGNEIISIDDYDILYSYYDCWKCTTERLNAVFQGIVEADSQTENAVKHRINATDKANDAKDQTVASIYDNRFCIPLDFEILESSLPLYQYGLGGRLTYELTFADYSDVIKATNPDTTYTITNIILEFDTIINASLASQIRTEYMKSRSAKKAGAIQKNLQLHNLNIASYFTDKYALWLDFRTIDDNRLHGSGRHLENTSEGIRLQITKESGSAGKLSCYLANIFRGRIEYELIYSLRDAKHRVDYSVHI